MLNALKFQFTAQDRTAAAFRSVRGELGNIKGALVGVQDYARRSGRAMRNIGAGLSAGVTAPLMLLGKQSLSLYDQQVRAEKAVEQAIKSTGGAAGKTAAELKSLASGLQGVTTFGDEDILQNVTAPLLTFTKVQGEVFDRAQANVLDMATLLKMDLKSASILVGKALNDPIKGISALSRSGVQFSEEQKAVIKSLVETGQVARAQAVILGELETQFKGQAEAAAAAPLGQWRQLSNAVGDLKEELGGQIVPFLKPLTEQAQAAVKWFGSLSPEVKKNVVVFGGLAAVVGPVVAVLGLATLGVTGLVTAVTTAVGAFGLLSGPVGVAALAIGGLTALIAALWPEKDKVTAATDTLTSAIGDEITQSQLLTGVLEKNGAMSVAVAEKKLKEARARHQNVVAIIAEKRALALGSTEYADLTRQIGDAQAALNSLGFPARDVAISRRADAFEEAQQRLADLLVERQNLLKSDDQMTEQLQRTEQNIQKLEAALANAKDGMVTFGNSLVLPIKPGERFSTVLSRGGSASKGLAEEVRGLKDELGGLATVGKEVTDQLGGMFASAMTSIVNGTKSAKSALADLARQVVNMAMNRAFTSLFDTIFSSFGWFGGGGVAPVTKSANGNVFAGGNVVPFARGGVVGGPTLFPMRGGAGLMGEAGPEAIMPLRRGPDGKLGVQARGGGGGQTTVAVNVTVENHATNTRVEAAPSADGGVMIQIFDAIEGAWIDGRFDRAARIRHGIAPQPLGA